MLANTKSSTLTTTKTIDIKTDTTTLMKSSTSTTLVILPSESTTIILNKKETASIISPLSSLSETSAQPIVDTTSDYIMISTEVPTLTNELTLIHTFFKTISVDKVSITISANDMGNSSSSNQTMNIIFITGSILIVVLIAISLMICIIYKKRQSKLKSNFSLANLLAKSDQNLDTISKTTYDFPTITQVGPQFANNDITHVSVTSIWRTNTEITQNTLLETQNSSKLGPISIPGYLLIEPSDFQLLDKIGQGGFGEIYKVNLTASADSEVYKRSNGRKLVAKCMKTLGDSMFQQEVSIMSMFVNRKYFAEMVGYESQSMTILMVFYKHGSLANWTGNLKEMKHIFEITYGLVSAIKTMHKNGLVHCDIKPGNILIDIDSQGTMIPKLTDFGCTNIVETQILKVSEFKVEKSNGLSVWYASPERLSGKSFSAIHFVPITKAGDIYSLSIVIYDLVNSDLILW